MHKHFRVIAISEHLRYHGFDPDFYIHTRIPGIWAKLRTYYDLDIIDERENNFDNVEDGTYGAAYRDFSLPWNEYGEEMMRRARADDSQAPTSPAQFQPDSPPPSASASAARKRKRSDAAVVPKTRSSTVDDTEGDVSAPSPGPKSTRGARGVRRTASKAKAESTERETTADESSGEDEQSGQEDEEAEEELNETPAAKKGRAAGTRGKGTRATGRSRGRGRGRGR